MTNRDVTGASTGLSRAGFTLVEIMIALLLAAMTSAGIIRGIVLAKGLNQSSEQRVVAFSMARAQMEEIQGRTYNELVIPVEIEEDLPLTHLGGVGQQALLCERRTFVLPRTNPTRKEVYVLVRWEYRGRPMSEILQGNVYEKGI